MTETDAGGVDAFMLHGLTAEGVPSAFDPMTVSDLLSSKHASLRAPKDWGTPHVAPPQSVVAVDSSHTVQEALDELALSKIKSVPVRDPATGAVLGFFDATRALRLALDVAGRAEREVAFGATKVSALVDRRLESGRGGDGGAFPFAAAQLPLRELVGEEGYLLFEQHGPSDDDGGGARRAYWFTADVHRLAVVDSSPTRNEGKEEETLPSSPLLKHEEIVDIISQLDVVRCVVDAYGVLYDREYPAEGQIDVLRRALEEPAAAVATSAVFGTFYDAPAREVFKEMLHEGYGAAVIVERQKDTIVGADDPEAWRAADVLSASDFSNVKDVSLLRPVSDGGATVREFLNVAVKGAPRRLTAVRDDANVIDCARAMLDDGVHRAWILSDRDVPVGCVSATDVLRCVSTAHRRYAPQRSRPVQVPIA
jgi:CBS domain-containing protein